MEPVPITKSNQAMIKLYNASLGLENTLGTKCWERHTAKEPFQDLWSRVMTEKKPGYPDFERPGIDFEDTYYAEDVDAWASEHVAEHVEVVTAMDELLVDLAKHITNLNSKIRLLEADVKFEKDTGQLHRNKALDFREERDVLQEKNKKLRQALEKKAEETDDQPKTAEVGQV